MLPVLTFLTAPTPHKITWLSSKCVARYHDQSSQKPKDLIGVDEGLQEALQEGEHLRSRVWHSNFVLTDVDRTTFLQEEARLFKVLCNGNTVINGQINARSIHACKGFFCGFNPLYHLYPGTPGWGWALKGEIVTWDDFPGIEINSLKKMSCRKQEKAKISSVSRTGDYSEERGKQFVSLRP